MVTHRPNHWHSESAVNRGMRFPPALLKRSLAAQKGRSGFTERVGKLFDEVRARGGQVNGWSIEVLVFCFADQEQAE
jgi:hypothetical protein